MNPVLLSAFFDATSGFRWVITEARRFPDVSVVKILPAISGDMGDAGLVPESIPGSGRFPWGKEWQPTPVLLPRKSHEQRSLMGCSLWGHKESDITERLSLPTHIRSKIPKKLLKQ